MDSHFASAGAGQATAGHRQHNAGAASGVQEKDCS